jgi:hypothetical protein
MPVVRLFAADFSLSLIMTDLDYLSYVFQAKHSDTFLRELLSA